MTVTRSELARSELVDRILDEVDRQLDLGEYLPDNFGDAEKLSPLARTDLAAVIEDVLDEACREVRA